MYSWFSGRTMDNFIFHDSLILAQYIPYTASTRQPPCLQFFLYALFNSTNCKVNKLTFSSYHVDTFFNLLLMLREIKTEHQRRGIIQCSCKERRSKKIFSDTTCFTIFHRNISDINCFLTSNTSDLQPER